MNRTGNRAPLVAYGIPMLPSGVGTLCRRELADHIAALCDQLHGPRRTDCTTCAALTSPPSTPDWPPVGGGEHDCPHLSLLDRLDGLRCPCRRSVSPDETRAEREHRQAIGRLRDAI